MVMTNLFSMFDPSVYAFSMAWLILIFPIITIMSAKPLKNNKINSLINYSKNLMMKEVKELMVSNHKKASSSTMSVMFMMIMLTNLIALVPFNFTTTAHASISLTLALTMWASIMLYGWSKSFKMMMAHLTPTGTPDQLMNFMVLIEVVSNLIRPITLSVRLSANMVAGHLLMQLLSNLSILSQTTMMMSAMPMLVLTSLEMAVCMIQAYVLATLVTLYHNEAF